MTLRRSRSIDSLYEAVNGVDLVITADGPLSLALDNRVQAPRLGRLAATPRSHASGEMVPEDIRDLFIRFCEQTEYPWKTATRALELTIACWTETGEREQILEQTEFDVPAIRDAVTFLAETDSSYSAVTERSLSDDLEVCVVDEPQLNALDRRYLPDEYKTVSSLVDEPATLPPMHCYASTTALVEAVLNTITAENATDVGIVVPMGSQYASLIESGLAEQGIPTRGGAGFTDDPLVRAFCRLCESVFEGSNQRVRDLRPILTAVGITPSRALDERRVDAVSEGELGGYRTFKETVTEGTFAEALQAFADLADDYPTTVHREFDTLGLLDAPVTEERFAEFRYYVDSFTVPGPDGDDPDGVLLTGATATAYIDRPIVFYLGLGPDWAQSPPDYPWVDSDAFLERDLRRFERLLGNGEQRYFLVQESRAGDDVQPCVYLRELLDESFDSFADLPHVDHGGISESVAQSPFAGASEGRRDPTPETTISQSRLKSLVNAPRDVYFDQLVKSPTSFAQARGTVLHEAAEIYVEEPTVLRDRREEVLDEMCEILAPYLANAQRPVQRTQLEIGLEAIIESLDADPPERTTYETYDVRDRENELADALEVTIESPIVERWFESSEVGVHGFVDLLAKPTAVVDYKTGRKQDAQSHLDAATFDPVADRPNFQALVYLAKHREERPDQQLEMRFVYLLDSDHVDATVSGTPPAAADRVTTITYVPATFSEFVARPETFETLTDYADSNPRVKTLSQLGYDAYRQFFEANELPREDVAPEQRAEVQDAFIAFAKERVGEYAYVQDGCEAIIDDLADVPAGYVLESDLDALEAFIDERLDELNTYRTSRFPVAFKDDGPTWDRVNHRDLILTDR